MKLAVAPSVIPMSFSRIIPPTPKGAFLYAGYFVSRAGDGRFFGLHRLYLHLREGLT